MGKDDKGIYGVEGESVAISAVKIRSVAMFATVVVTALLLCVCVIVSSSLFRPAGTSPDTIEGCPSCPEGQKMMDTDMVKETMYRMEDGSMVTDHFEYSLDSNTVVVESPGNFSGFSASTIALDYDRTLLFINAHDDNSCFVVPWPSDLATMVEEFMSTEGNDREIIEAVSMAVDRRPFITGAVVPNGYLKASNGMTVRALCSGRDTYWLDPVSQTSTRHRRRSLRSRILRFILRIFGVKTNFVIDLVIDLI